jgi:hypothetical protein
VVNGVVEALVSITRVQVYLEARDVKGQWAAEGQREAKGAAGAGAAAAAGSRYRLVGFSPGQVDHAVAAQLVGASFAWRQVGAAAAAAAAQPGPAACPYPAALPTSCCAARGLHGCHSGLACVWQCYPCAAAVGAGWHRPAGPPCAPPHRCRSRATPPASST